MSKELLNKAISLIKAGDKKGAKGILRKLIEQEPNNEMAWLWFSVCVVNVENKIFCLKKVIEINPGNPKASQALNKLLQSEPSLEEIIPKATQNSATSQENKSISKMPNDLVKRLRLALLIVSSIFLFLTTLAPVWNSSYEVRTEIATNIMGSLIDDNKAMTFQEFEDMATQKINVAMGKYLAALQLHKIIVMISVAFVVVDVISSRLMNKQLPKVIFLVIGIILLIFPTINLFLSWSLFVVPGMLGTIVGAVFYIIIGII